MSPLSAALLLVVLWIVSSVGVRVLLHHKSTGALGLNRLRARPGSAEWIGGVLFVVSLAALAVGPLVATGGSKWGPLEAVGGIVGTLGVVFTFVAQGALGDSWRIGVDQNERTTLRTEGLYAIVRNPIFTAMIITATGLVFLSPTLLTVVGVIGLTLSIELQVRMVEEPYLARIHGQEFNEYRTKVGRFLPKLKN
jgi:protein-S-isoprenylcysteine O-methyltransferase Ste14